MHAYNLNFCRYLFFRTLYLVSSNHLNSDSYTSFQIFKYKPTKVTKYKTNDKFTI